MRAALVLALSALAGPAAGACREMPVAQVSMAIVLDDAHMERTEQIAEDLKGLGLEVGRVIPEAGAIYGTAAETTLEAIRTYEGVLEVREEGVVRLPPSDPRIPQ